MNELRLPQLADELADCLKHLHQERRKLQVERKKLTQERRRQLTDAERKKVLDKTGGHCHLCGGDMTQNSDGMLRVTDTS